MEPRHKRYKVKKLKQKARSNTCMRAVPLKRVMLFLGAGASASFGYPTTQSFLEELKAELGESAEGLLFSNLIKVPHVKDVEHVLEMLEALRIFEKHPLRELTARFQTSVNLERLSNNLPDLLRLADKLEDRIQSDVYRQYEFSPKTLDSVINAYEPLMEMIFLRREDNEIPVFTTNYDRVIEEFCSHSEYLCVDGFERRGRAEEFDWKPSEYDEVVRGKPPNQPIVKLFKLHGSLNWRRRHDNSIVKVSTEERTRGTKRFKENLVIYPAEKFKPEIEPFNTLHVLFKRIFAESEIAIFVGFKFRDEYLNEIIFNEIISEDTGKKKIIVVSPHATQTVEALEDRYADGFPNKILVPIESSFGEQNINMINRISDEIAKFVSSKSMTR